MSIERWGSLSVDDHVDTEALLANVLLYDRLVIPVFTEQAGRDERKYWDDHGWNPDLQQTRLNQLGNLAVRRLWNNARRERYKDRMQELKAEQFDADAKQTTRAILAQEQVIEKFPGVNRVTVIAAYNSEKGLREDFDFTEVEDNLSAQGYLLTRKLAVPLLASDEVALKEAIELSADSDFRAKRSRLFDWQDAAANKKWTPQQAVDEISQMADLYNASVTSAFDKVKWKFAFTIAGMALPFFGGHLAIKGASAGLAFIRFAMFDKKATPGATNTEPAAMFHDIQANVGIKLAVQ